MPLPMNAAGTILVSTFVSNGPGDNKVSQSGANSLIFGVSQKLPMLVMPGVNPNGQAALAGQPLLVYQNGDRYGDEVQDLDLSRRPPDITETGGPVITSGAPFPAGCWLKSDASGNAVQALLDGDNVGAVALARAGKAGVLIPCQVLITQLKAAWPS